MDKITLNPKALDTALGRVQHAVSAATTKPILNTVLFEGTEQGLRLVAADNYRMAIQPIELRGADKGKALGVVTVRLDDIKALRAYLKGRHTAVVLSVEGEGQGQVLVVSCSGTVLRCPTAYGAFPKYTDVLEPALAKARMVVALNPRFILDAAEALGKDWSVAKIMPGPSHLDPLVIKGTDGYVEVIMPVRTASEEDD
jgi:DNA polymerase III sliding clamp (beta) subunit (PCNA family)